MSDVAAIHDLVQKRTALKKEIAKIIVGQDAVIDQIVLSIFSGGHALLVGVPGLAKTLMVNTLAQALGLDFKRIQFTPDLMPSDVIGTAVFSPKTTEFQFRKGPIFGNIVLVDEINRAPAKTQAALFEAMEERQVTVEGETRPLPDPFFVIATQNPSHQIGTFPLPESQLDRFLMRIELGYPDRNAERALLVSGGQRAQADQLMPLIEAGDLPSMQREAAAVHAAEPLIDYVQALVEAGTPFDALFAVCDPIALGALDELHARGLSVPGQVGLHLLRVHPHAAWSGA